MDTIIWGIIGCGDVAEVKSGPAFYKCKDSELLAVMRRDADKAADFAKRHQVPMWYDDASLLLQNETINAVYIATPPAAHLQMALQVLDAGKDIYLEKPMVLSATEALILQQAVAESQNKVVVAHYRRQLPMFLKIKELLATDAIGLIGNVILKYFREAKPDVNWRLDPSVSGGGYFHDLAPHQIDLMYCFFGDHESVSGSNIDPTNNTVHGQISFKNGIQLEGIWDFNAASGSDLDLCTVYGSKGSISFSVFGNQITIESHGKKETLQFDHPQHIQQPFIQQTVNHFLGKTKNPCTVSEGLIVNEIMDAFTGK